MRKYLFGAVPLILLLVAVGFYKNSDTGFQLNSVANAAQVAIPEVKPTALPESPRVNTPEPSAKPAEIRTERDHYGNVEIFHGEPNLTRSQILYFFTAGLIKAFDEAEAAEEDSVTWNNLADNLAEDFLDQNAKTSAWLESVYKRVMSRDSQLPVQIARQLKIIPGAETAFSGLGKFFIRKYADMNWNEKLVFYQETKHQVQVQGNVQNYLKSEDIYSEPQTPKRNAQGRLLTCEQGEPVDVGKWSCPPITFADEDKEKHLRKIDKLVFRAGPIFYQNAVWFYQTTMAELKLLKDF